MMMKTGILGAVALLGLALPARADHATEQTAVGTVVTEGCRYLLARENCHERYLIVNPFDCVRRLAYHRVEIRFRQTECGVEVLSIRKAPLPCIQPVVIERPVIVEPVRPVVVYEREPRFEVRVDLGRRCERPARSHRRVFSRRHSSVVVVP